MGFSAIIPVSDMATANAALEAAGHGPRNFSVPVYGNSRAGWATLHAWSDPVFQSAVESTGAIVSTAGQSPQERVANAISEVSATAGFGADAQTLEGHVTPGLYRDDESVLWWVIQAYDTVVYPDPTVIPALIRKARIPGEAAPWVQPLDQFDAYRLVDPFTDAGELATHNGQTWQVTAGDGAGNNVWEPGVFGWTILGEEPGDPGEPPGQWVDSGATFTSLLGSGVISVSDSTVFTPPQQIRISEMEIPCTGIHSPGVLNVTLTQEQSNTLQWDTPSGTPIEVQS